MRASLASVSSEGGPVLIGDSLRVASWRGIDADGSDYDLACKVTTSADLVAIDPSLLVWDFGGPGTAYIVRVDDVLACVRIWADEECDDDTIRTLVTAICFEDSGVQLAVPSGIAVFLWAPEDGKTISTFEGVCGVPNGDFSMDGVSHFERVIPAVFSVSSAKGRHGEIEYTAIQLKMRE